MSAEALLEKLEGPWLPRWVPQPRRVEVEAATDRLRDLEAQILFGRTAARRALRCWAEGDDERPMVTKLRVAHRHWSHSARIHSWQVWSERAAVGARRRRCVRSAVQRMRAERLRDGMDAWKAVRVAGVRRRLDSARSCRLGRAGSRALHRWRELVVERSRRYEEALILTSVFRRWLLFQQTSLLGRLLAADHLAHLDEQLSRDLTLDAGS